MTAVMDLLFFVGFPSTVCVICVFGQNFNWLLANSDDLVIIQLVNIVYDCFEIHGK